MSEISRGRLWWTNATGLVFAVLQGACVLVLAVSGFRVAIGLGALAAAVGTSAPARGFHSDAIRIPMMLLALVAAAANLYMLWRVRSLRARPAAQWRMQPLTSAQRRSEWLQFALAILTLSVLAAEWVTHRMIHHG